MSMLWARLKANNSANLMIAPRLKRSSAIQLTPNLIFFAGHRLAGKVRYSSRIPGSRPSRLAPRRKIQGRKTDPIAHTAKERQLGLDGQQNTFPVQDRKAAPPTNAKSDQPSNSSLHSSLSANHVSDQDLTTKSKNLPVLRHSTVPVPIAKDGEKGVIDQDTSLRESVESILGQSTLVVTRQMEMLNVFLGFEQANKYSILTPEGYQVGYLAESDKGMLGGTLKRQFLRTHRSFEAHVMDTTGRVVLSIRRPLTLINSRIKVFIPHPSTGEERLVGEVHQIWHLYKRKYELFVNQTDESGSNESMAQFAGIDGDNRPLGAITRNFRGFGRELFTDTGQYVLTFDPTQNRELDDKIALESPKMSKSAQSSLPSPSSEKEQSSLTRSATGKELILSGPSRALTMDERAVALATAISADFDYFSRHSGNQPSMFPPFFMMGGGGNAETPAPPPTGTQEPVGQGQDSSGAQAPAGTGADYDLSPGEQQNSLPGQTSHPDLGSNSSSSNNLPWWEQDGTSPSQGEGDLGVGQEEVWNDQDPWQSDDNLGTGDSGEGDWGWTDWLPGGGDS
ncbi:hypothetical protein IEQ34_025539 [Dendrobium chrysotoxum]|uniref:Scramblase-domain-containing protein n=1 Tax=Dendrobium chrysotoxum TaxID=161865 RepID=A0AAV7FQD0_DENCH|nr:hypothetical protein IEQ34_025539 [Dendrobium chrysotoxum]